MVRLVATLATNRTIPGTRPGASRSREPPGVATNRTIPGTRPGASRSREPPGVATSRTIPGTRPGASRVRAHGAVHLRLLGFNYCNNGKAPARTWNDDLTTRAQQFAPELAVFG